MTDELRDLVAAIDVLEGCREAVGKYLGVTPDDALARYAHGRLERARAHLAERIVRYFGDRPPLTTEQAAIVFVREIAGELRAAGEALEAAARALKDDGKGYRASQAHTASRRALQAAEEACA
jgi:hypothetical protein